MRTLKFIVDKQNITADPYCDFEGLVPGTEGYLRAEFSFSSEWRGCTKVAGFYSRLGKEFEPQILDDKNGCTIPAEALTGRAFSIRVIGRKDNAKLVTNKIVICQKG